MHCKFTRNGVFEIIDTHRALFDYCQSNEGEAVQVPPFVITHAASHQPIVITGKRGNAVLVSEEDWNAISETLYLLSVPGMRGFLEKGMEQDQSECSKELDW